MFPTTFHEFHRDYPDFVRQVIHKNRWVQFEDVPDLEQELLSELLRKQVVEKFNPGVYDGEANIKLFMGYIKTCVERMFYTTQISAKNAKRSVNYIAISLSTPPLDDSDGAQTLIDTLDDNGRACGQLMAITEINQMVGYIDTHHPDLTSTLAAVITHQSINARELSRQSGMLSSTLTGRIQKLLRVLRQKNKRTINP